MTPTHEDKGQPRNIEAERYVLGAALLDNQTFGQAVELLRPGDFYLSAHRVLFQEMAALWEAGKGIDFVTLCNAVDEAGQLEAVGGRSFVSGLIDEVPRLSNLGHYARIVSENARIRRLIKTLIEAQDLVEKSEGEADKMDATIGALRDALDLEAGGPDQAPVSRPIADYSNDPVPVSVLCKAGDAFGSVLSVGEVAVLSGAGKVGKSTLALQIAAAAGAPVIEGTQAYQEVLGLDVLTGPAALVSYEDTGRRIYDRAMAASATANLPDSLHVVEALGHPLFGVGEGEHLQARPKRLPFWYRLFAWVRKVKPALVVIDPASSAFQGNSADVTAARAAWMLCAVRPSGEGSASW